MGWKIIQQWCRKMGGIKINKDDYNIDVGGVGAETC